MGEIEGGPKAYGVAKNPRGNRQGVGGGVDSPRGTNIPRVEEFPWRDEIYGVNLKGDRVWGEDGQGRGGDTKSLATQDTKWSTITCRIEEMDI